VRELPGGISGSQEFLYQRHGISAQSLAEAVAGALRGQL